MKKILIALSALALIASTAVSCKKDNKEPEVTKPTVEVLNATPNSISKFVNDSFVVSFDATTPGNVNVEVKPMDAKYALSVSDEAILKVEGLKVTCLAVGNANLIIKAGDKEAKVAVEVKEVAAIDENYLIGAPIKGVENRIYMPKDFSNMKAEGALIRSSMTTLGWLDVDPTGEKIDFAYKFLIPNDGKQFTEDRLFLTIVYFHTPSQGAPFAYAQPVYVTTENTAAEVEKLGKAIAQLYGFPEPKMGTLSDESPCMVAYHGDTTNHPNLEMLVYLTPSLDENKNQTVDKDGKPQYNWIVQFSNKAPKTRSGEKLVAYEIPREINVFNPFRF